MFALLHKNIVIQIEENKFPTNPELEWIDIDDDIIVVGSTYNPNNDSFELPVIKDKIDILDAILQFNLGKITKSDLQTISDNYKNISVKVNK